MLRPYVARRCLTWYELGFGGYVWTRLKIRNKIFVKNICVYLEYLHIEYEFSNKYIFFKFRWTNRKLNAAIKRYIDRSDHIYCQKYGSKNNTEWSIFFLFYILLPFFDNNFLNKVWSLMKWIHRFDLVSLSQRKSFAWSETRLKF